MYEITLNSKKMEFTYWKDIWLYRELLFFLAWKDVLIRYKQTIIGIAWVVIQPVLLTTIFTFIFRNVAGFSSEDTPYPIIVMLGMLPWQFFSNSINDAGNSLIINSNMITKVYFPRIIIPLSTILVKSIDLFVSFTLFIILALYYQLGLSSKILCVPIFLIILFLFISGVALWVSALTVKYRDFRFIIPFVTQLSLYISPVGFILNVMPKKYQFLYSLNPLVGVIEGFRWSFIPNYNNLNSLIVINMIVITATLLGTGLLFFRKVEKEIADII